MGHYFNDPPRFHSCVMKNTDTGEELWVHSEAEVRSLIDSGNWVNRDQPGRVCTHNNRGDARRDDPRYSAKGKKLMKADCSGKVYKFHPPEGTLVGNFMRDTSFLDAGAGGVWQRDNIKGDKS